MGLFDRLFGKPEERTTEDLDRISEDQEQQPIEGEETVASQPQSETIFEGKEDDQVLSASGQEPGESLQEAAQGSPLADTPADPMVKYYALKAQMAKELEEKTASLEDAEDGSSSEPTQTSVSEEDVLPLQEAEASSQESQEDKYNRSLKKTRTGFGARLNAFLANFRTVDEEFFEDLEETLILSDVGVSVASQLTEELRQEAKLENAKKPDVLRRLIIEKLVDIYEKDGSFNEEIAIQEGVTVMLFVGVNGVGKTTSIGKLAYKYKNQGKKVMLVAADTFRAGAVAQLVEWGRRVEVPVITGPEKADPASVVFDGVEKALAENVDILMIDTAGRLQNKDNLMAELEKIGRIIKRVIPEAPHETLLALDASMGQNALVQAKEFSKITPLTGLVLTKIDGTARGGVVLAIRQELDIPVKFIGFGEKIDDIGEFHSENFMQGLLEGLV
ncbi:signal recognition particle-docking protein FtsY [Streptococcus ferus]|uniref:signal recognition particle-docking protein FtsY n=1 Tax=Streptococcus ferus TaxID=1345 RepID=UPI0035A117FA